MVRCLDKLAGLVDFGKSPFLENPGSKLNLFAVYNDNKSSQETTSSFL